MYLCIERYTLAYVLCVHSTYLTHYIHTHTLCNPSPSSVHRQSQAVCHFPRLLVTAHSNAAVEQLQQRARAGCFIDQNGGALEELG